METEENGIFCECFELQLSEVEMLSSMYPNSSEFNITLPCVLVDMNRFLTGKTKRVPNQLDFTLNLDIPCVKEKLEVNIGFPHEYPKSKPDVSARSSGLSRIQQRDLNSDITQYLETIPEGDLCIIFLINWLTENASQYFSLQSSLKNSELISNQDNVKNTFCRMWIYSHHIFSKFKRREIIDCGEDLNFTGFSLPGKPGFICIEGLKKDCDDFLLQLKQMSWKKISLIKEEVTEIENNDISEFRKFEHFQEISFQVRRGPGKEYHMDMGQFLKYLETHNCAYAFHDLFGLEGRTSVEK